MQTWWKKWPQTHTGKALQYLGAHPFQFPVATRGSPAHQHVPRSAARGTCGLTCTSLKSFSRRIFLAGGASSDINDLILSSHDLCAHTDAIAHSERSYVGTTRRYASFTAQCTNRCSECALLFMFIIPVVRARALRRQYNLCNATTTAALQSAPLLVILLNWTLRLHMRHTTDRPRVEYSSCFRLIRS